MKLKMAKSPTSPFAIRFSDKQLHDLREVSEKQGMPVATLIKVCVEALLRQYRENPDSVNMLKWNDVANQLDHRRTDSQPSTTAGMLADANSSPNLSQPQQLAEKTATEKPLARANPIPAPKKKGMTVAEAEALHHSPPPILGEIAAGTPSAPAVGIKRRGKMIIPPGAIILETNLPPIPKPMPVMKPEKIQPAPKQPRSRPFPTTSDKALKSVPRADEEYSGADAG